jgi:hypothetical protein
MAKNIPVSSESLCKTCKYRHRRVFLVSNPNEYIDEDGRRPFKNKKDNVIIISNFCLVTGVEVGGEITIECSDYKEKDGSGSPVKCVKWRPE